MCSEKRIPKKALNVLFSKDPRLKIVLYFREYSVSGSMSFFKTELSKNGLAWFVKGDISTLNLENLENLFQHFSNKF